FLNNIHVFSALTELESKADSVQLIDYQPTLRKVGKSVTRGRFQNPKMCPSEYEIIAADNVNLSNDDHILKKKV
uniref:Uncharacterized protein n=1 Tax=Glossina palpalis gambiensis TaxID=67801 RepID=A0A1B0ASU2_9MUSC